MICEAPITRGPHKGQSATGTRTGYHRHWAAGEKACDPCNTANNEANAERRTSESGRVQERKWDSHGHLQAVAVTCRGCGSKGKANPVVTGGRRKVDSCSQCRGVA